MQIRAALQVDLRAVEREHASTAPEMRSSPVLERVCRHLMNHAAQKPRGNLLSRLAERRSRDRPRRRHWKPVIARFVPQALEQEFVGTDLTFEFIPGPAASQQRSIEITDDHGDLLACLDVTCSVPPTLVASPEVLHAGWVFAGANPVMQWIDVAYPIGEASSAIEAVDLEVDLEGDLRLQSTPSIASDGSGSFRVGIACEFTEPTVFGALESIVVLSSRRDPNLRGTGRILVERVPPGIGAGWPSCHLGRIAGALPTVLRFPHLTAPVIGKGTGQFEGGLAPQWSSDAGGWRLLVDEGLARDGEDRIVDLAIASGLLRIRLPSAVQ